METIERARPEQGIATLCVATDALSLAGLHACLGGHDEIAVVLDAQVASVAVLAAGTLDEDLLLTMKELQREDDLRIVLVVDVVEEEGLLAAVEQGFSGLLLRRTASAASLVAAVVGAHNGDSVVPPEVLGRLLAAVQRAGRGRAAAAPLPGVLDPREREVVRLLAEGLDTAEIATALSYSTRTIKNVLHGIMVRMNLRNRTHVVAHALRSDLL